MARPLRVQVPGAWCHITARGNEQRAIFRREGDQEHFLKLLEELVNRFRFRLHAYVLMANHYHLLAEPLESNLSAAMQWLNGAYTAWFNRRHDRAGHLFQGRFKALLIEEESWAVEASRYVHLNPVRTRAHGLTKRDQARTRAGTTERPAAEAIQERLAQLRDYRWSSFRAYAGLEKPPEWLSLTGVMSLFGRGGAGAKREYRRFVEEAIREGVSVPLWDSLKGQLVIGSEEFLSKVQGLIEGNDREQPTLAQLRPRPGWEEVKTAVSELKGEAWERFAERHGDYGRDLALYVARRNCGLKLKELGALAGGIDYATVSAAVGRWRVRMAQNRPLKKLTERVEARLLNAKT